MARHEPSGHDARATGRSRVEAQVPPADDSPEPKATRPPARVKARVPQAGDAPGAPPQPGGPRARVEARVPTDAPVAGGAPDEPPQPEGPRVRVEARVPGDATVAVEDDIGVVPPPAPGLERVVRRRRPATAVEAKALGHPLRLRILRLCSNDELTNKQLADRLGSDPGTVLYHVRQLVAAGLLAPADVRTGASGALEKPYRSTGVTWWLDGPLNDESPEVRFAPVEAFLQELSEAGPASVATFERFYLHLSDDEVTELDRRILDVLDEYVATDDERRGRPGRQVYGGVFVLHRLAGSDRDPG